MTKVVVVHVDFFNSVESNPWVQVEERVTTCVIKHGVSVLGVGVSRQNWRDPYSPYTGQEKALTRALACIERRLILPVKGERNFFYGRTIREAVWREFFLKNYISTAINLRCPDDLMVVIREH